MGKIQYNQKTAVIALVVVIAVCIAGGFGLAKLSAVVRGGGNAADAQKLIGNWTEQSAGTQVTFAKNGDFSIMDSVAATYEVNAAKSTITFDYKKAYGGQTVVMNYKLDKNKLTMTNTSNDQSQTYKKSQNTQK